MTPILWRICMESDWNGVKVIIKFQDRRSIVVWSKSFSNSTNSEKFSLRIVHFVWTVRKVHIGRTMWTVLFLKSSNSSNSAGVNTVPCTLILSKQKKICSANYLLKLIFLGTLRIRSLIGSQKHAEVIYFRSFDKRFHRW